MNTTRRGRRVRYVWVVAALSCLAVGSAAQPGTAEAPEWTQVATHPEASQQPTQTGRTLVDLAVVGDRLYAGYGDYAQNTGPIAVDPSDISGGVFTGAEALAPTHQIGVWRQLNGSLGTPNIDPLGDGADALDGQAGFETSDGSGSWTHTTVAPAYHVFDLAAGPSGSLWAVGSGSTASGGAAVAWQSTDGGATWTRKRVDNDTTTGSDRYYWVAAVDGAIYLQASYDGAPLRRFQGGAWSIVQPVSTQELCDTSRPNRVETFGGAIVCGDSGGIHTYTPATGTVTTAHLDGTVARDFFTTSTQIYALTAKGVYSSTDGRTWINVHTAPVGATSIAVSGGTYYVGTDDARILSAGG